MSSYMWALVDENGNLIEDGCKVDLPIYRIEPSTPAYTDFHFSSGDYTPFFDDIKLDQMINEWFEDNEEVPEA